MSYSEAELNNMHDLYAPEYDPLLENDFLDNKLLNIEEEQK